MRFWRHDAAHTYLCDAADGVNSSCFSFSFSPCSALAKVAITAHVNDVKISMRLLCPSACCELHTVLCLRCRFQLGHNQAKEEREPVKWFHHICSETHDIDAHMPSMLSPM